MHFRIKVGTFTQKAHPILSWFVIASCIVTVGLLYVVEKAEEAAQGIESSSPYTAYL